MLFRPIWKWIRLCDNDDGVDDDEDKDNVKFSCGGDLTPLFTPLEDQMIDYTLLITSRARK